MSPSPSPIEIDTGPQPGASILVLHGLGAHGDDFVPLAEQLDLVAIGPVRFVFPFAPVQPRRRAAFRPTASSSPVFRRAAPWR